MEAAGYRKMSIEDMRIREGELRRNIFNLRTRATTKELENNTLLPQERRELARLLTILAESEKEAKGSQA